MCAEIAENGTGYFFSRSRTLSPKDQERLFKPDYALELLGIAEGDLKSATSLFKTREGRAENICFLVQQAMEKALKSVLCANRVPVPLVHDLGILIAKLPEKLSPPQGYHLGRYNDFAAVRRYEEGGSELTSEDLQTAIATGNEVIAWASTQVREALKK